jgi:hypothetical protein
MLQELEEIVSSDNTGGDVAGSHHVEIRIASNGAEEEVK